MQGERTPFDKLRAVLLTTCLLVAAIAGPLMAPVAVGGVSAQSGTTFVAEDTAANAGNTATIGINYDVSSEGVPAENLMINVYENRMIPVGNTELTELSGDTTVDIDVADKPGDYRVFVDIREEGGDSIENDSATVDVTSPVGVTDFSAPAAGNTGEKINLGVDVENADSQSRDVRLNAYFDGFASPAGSTTYPDSPEGESSTTLQATVPVHLMPGPHEVTVNDQGTKTVMVSDPDVSFSGLSVTTGEGSVTATATVTNEKGSSEQIIVPLYVDGAESSLKPVSLGGSESKQISISTAVTAGNHEVGVGDLWPQLVSVKSGDGGGGGVPGGGDDTPSYDVIKGVSVERSAGNAPSQDPKLRVSDPSGNILMDAEVLTPSDRYELSDIGADTSTEFKIELKVHEDHEPLMLLGTAQDVSWSKEEITGENYYRVTVHAKPMEAQYVASPPDQWGTDEESYIEAEFAYDATLDISFITSDMIDSTLDGATIATDAQSIGSPNYDQQSKSLQLYVGGPHYETDGTTVNTGEYEAFLPDALLNEWGVTDPTSELQANYGDQQYDSNTAGFEVTDQGVSGGVLVEFPIHYSEGTVSVSPADSESDDSGTDDSESDGTSYSPPSWSPPSNTDDADDTDATTVESETTTEPEMTSKPFSPDTATSKSATTTVEATTTTTPETTVAETATQTETTTAVTTIDTTTEAADSTTEESSNGGGVPGFGPAAAVVALLAAALLALRRSR